MASDTNLNIILGQGHAIKNIYNVKKQNLELQQHFAAQHTEVKEKRKKEKVVKYSAENKVRDKEDDTRECRKRSKASQRGPATQDDMETSPENEGSFIDIKV